MSHIRIFGSQAMTHIPKEKRKKFDSKSEELVFVGYCEDTKGYRLFRMGTKTIVKSRDVIFIENRKERQGKYLTNQHIVLLPDPEVLTTEEGNESEKNIEELSSGSEMFFGFPEFPLESTNEDMNLNTSDSTNEDQEMNLNTSDSFEDCSDSFEGPSDEVRRSTRVRKETVFYPNPVTYMSADAQSFDDPNSVRELEERSDAEVWKQAMKEEYNALINNKTWILCDLPDNKKALNCKWVFKSKRNVKGDIERYKARLVIKGCSQKLEMKKLFLQ